MEMISFLEFLVEKKKKVPFKQKKSKVWKDPLARHDMKASRGWARKTLAQTTLGKRSRGVYLPGLAHGLLPFTQSVLDNAKKSQGGLWRISYRQALELANKYHLKMPDDYDRSKKLGKTTILLWRKMPGVYFLVKNKRLKRLPRTRTSWVHPYH